jgi:type IV pilus assembly protein PilZ
VDEKRRHPRVVINLPISCDVTGGTKFQAIARDVSVGGMFVETSMAPAFGTNITIVGDFPGRPGMKIPAIVRWLTPGGFGVQFGLLGAAETHVLAAIVSKGRV